MFPLRIALVFIALGFMMENHSQIRPRHSLVFEAASASAEEPARFVARAPGYTALLSTEGVTFATGQSSIRMVFVGANPNASLVGQEHLETRVTYILGEDPATWRTNVPTYSKVQLRNAYPGIDVVYYSSQGHLEYDFVVNPGADAGLIHLAIEGARQLSTDSAGDLVMTTSDGEFHQRQPQAHQLHKNAAREVRSRYVLGGERNISLAVDNYDRGQVLWIDPVITYSTYLGGPGNDAVTGLAADSAGYLYVAGWTESTSFPGAVSSKSGTGGGTDAFVAKLSPTGAVVYLTYLGGRGDDRALAIGLDPSGCPVVTGRASSTDFPVSMATQASLAGGRNAFLTKLNPQGNGVVFSTYMGGNGIDDSNGLAIDIQGNIYVAGDTTSANFPTLNAFQNRLLGLQNAFVAKWTGAGRLVFSTYLGGSGTDSASGVAVDPFGGIYVAGGTTSRDFPVANAFQPHNAGGQDAFITKLNSQGSGLLYSTYFGGSSGTVSDPEMATAIAVDSTGSAYIAGFTSSPDLLLVNPLQASRHGTADAFATKISASGTAVEYSTYLGGSSGVDRATAIVVDGIGSAYIAGYTASSDFPVTAAIQGSLAGAYDAFLVRLAPPGNSLLLGTYIGGLDIDAANAVAVDGAGNTYVGGQTQSYNFPTLAASQPYMPSLMSGFVLKIATLLVNPQLVSPADNAILSSPLISFAWNAVSGAQDYWIDIGTSLCGSDIYGGYTGGVTSKSVDLTHFLNGQPIYVQLYSKFPGINLIGGTGKMYQFATQGPNLVLISPTPNAVLATSPVTFTWSPVAGANDYWIDIGTSLYGSNIYGGYTGGATSKSADLTRFLNGQPIYLQLYSKFSGINLVGGTGTIYQFATQSPNPVLISPAANAVLATSPVTFTWSPVAGANDYWIDIGTSLYGSDIYGGYTAGATSQSVNLSQFLNGQPIYLQLYSKFPGVGLVPGTGNRYQFGTQSPNPVLISPATNALLPSYVTFAWNPVTGAQDYWIDIGTSLNGSDIYGGYTGGAVSKSVTLGTSLSGRPIYVQLYAKFSGVGLIAGSGNHYQFSSGVY